MSFPERMEEFYEPPADVAGKFWLLHETILAMGSCDEQGRLQVPDEIQQAFHQACAGVMYNPDYPHFNAIVAEKLRQYPDREPVNVAHNLMRAAQSSIRRVERMLRTRFQIPPQYPFAMEDPESWRVVFFDGLERNSEERRLLKQNLDFNTQTNWPPRYVMAWAGAVMLGKANHENDIMDIGASAMLGLNLWALPRKKWPWPHTVITDQVRQGEPKRPNPRATAEFMRMLNDQSVPIRHGIGIDIQNSRDISTQRGQELHEFMFDCYYPSEYRDKPAMIYDAMRLMSYHFPSDEPEMTFYYPGGKQPRLDFYMTDATKFGHRDFQWLYPGFKPDIILYSTVFNQLGQLGLAAAEEQTGTYQKPDTTTLLFDFIDEIQPDGTIEPSKIWPGEDKYKLLGRARPKQPWLHLLTAKNGRVTEITPTDAGIELAYEQGYDLSPMAA